jgi:hypothetical protein
MNAAVLGVVKALGGLHEFSFSPVENAGGARIRTKYLEGT